MRLAVAGHGGGDVCALAVLLSSGGTRRPPDACWALLWLMLALALSLDQRLIRLAPGWTCEGGSRVLDAWGYSHVLGRLCPGRPGRQFLVEELGGGVQVLFALIAAAAVWPSVAAGG